ncbi:MAG: TetR/AcrR family transcriptional regulator [Rhodobacteraceae bacterium]|nr:TetR/AcrR family transcriptional regulator [Paracoccaceae bacterium]
MTAGPDPEDETDHRVRVARMRRERMRDRLLQSVLAICSATPAGSRPSIESVIAHADVSKATFYKYFASVDEAVGTLGAEMVDEMVANLITLLGDKPDEPLVAMSTSIHLFLMRSVTEPLWADFVARSDALGGDSEARHGLEMHIGDSFRAGLVRIVNYEAAVALAIGALMEGMRHIARHPERPNRPFVEGLLAQILIGLGVETPAARRLVDESAAFIRAAAPERLTWWRDPWGAA